MADATGSGGTALDGVTATATAGAAPTKRDEFIDFCRAFSLIVVVIWHWGFTILIWGDDGPWASNPIGFTTGLWVATWLFQVMPLFFFVGGFAHELVWNKLRAEGGRFYWRFVGGRAKRLVVPSLLLVAIWVGIGTAAVALGAPQEWVTKAVLLILSPLWFMVIYVLLVFMAPVMLRFHRHYGAIALVWLIALAGIVDVTRFRTDLDELGWLNMVFVWGICHQLGFFYEKLVHGDRQWSWAMMWGGLFGLFALVRTGIYPGSMVGVPGENSNMAPPTMCMVALVFFQAGLALLLRPYLLERLERPRWEAVNDTVNRFAMPLFLFHTSGMALALVIAKGFGFLPPPESDATWWLMRPIWILLPLACTLPIIFLFGKKWRSPMPKPTPQRRPDRRW